MRAMRVPFSDAADSLPLLLDLLTEHCLICCHVDAASLPRDANDFSPLFIFMLMMLYFLFR